jgi:hypothetical protein
MAIGTFAELQAAAASWLNRQDLTGVIPDFIALAEARINRDLRTAQMEVSTTLTTAAGTATVALPADFLEGRGLVLSDNGVATLDYKTPAALHAAWPNNTTGVPQDHTITGSNIELGPTPDGAYDLILTYYQRIPPLSASTPTNWLLTSSPDAYLYATLLESAPFLMDDGRVQVWGGLYDTAIGRIQTADGRARWGSGPLTITVER